MANTSIFAAFERMWHHVVAALADKQNVVTGTSGQIVGFDENGNAVAQDLNIPSSSASIPVVSATSTNGTAYTGTADGITALTAGLMIVFIPTRNSASTAPTFDLNGLGAKTIKRRQSNLSSTTTSGLTNNWLYLNKPQLFMYDGTYWIVVNQDKPAASDLYGSLAGTNVSYDNSTSGITATTMQAAVDELVGMSGGGVTIATGSYSGTNSAKTLTFDFIPKLLIITGVNPNNTGVFLTWTWVSGSTSLATSSTAKGSVTANGSTITIASSNGPTGSGYTYNYVAFG